MPDIGPTPTSGTTAFRVGAVVVIGVCGCGKSTVGPQLAKSLGYHFLEPWGYT